jgi:hypothetical protein
LFMASGAWSRSWPRLSAERGHGMLLAERCHSPGDRAHEASSVARMGVITGPHAACERAFVKEGSECGFSRGSVVTSSCPGALFC